jgi:hypothetical protein
MKRIACRWLVPAIVFAALPATGNAAPILWAGNGHYYEFFSGPVTWNQANALAGAATFDPGTGLLQGHLVTITSAAEDTFLSSAFGNTSNFWVAASDQVVEGEWRFVAGPEVGSLLSFFNWGPGEPNNVNGTEDHLVANWPFTPGLWNDWNPLCGTPTTCTTIANYVVEYSATTTPVPEPSSLTLLGAALAAACAWNARRRRRTNDSP